MLICRLVTGTICVAESSIGLPCPGCGLTRAWKAALHLQWREAFTWHPLFWLVPVIAAVWLGQLVWGKQKSPRWLTVFLITCFSVFLIVYVVRMVLYFPHTAPMATNPDSFTWRFVRALRWLWGKVG
jgi:hypothetical protein